MDKDGLLFKGLVVNDEHNELTRASFHRNVGFSTINSSEAPQADPQSSLLQLDRTVTLQRMFMILLLFIHFVIRLAWRLSILSLKLTTSLSTAAPANLALVMDIE